MDSQSFHYWAFAMLTFIAFILLYATLALIWIREDLKDMVQCMREWNSTPERKDAE
jgi:hypothetical protein